MAKEQLQQANHQSPQHNSSIEMELPRGGNVFTQTIGRALLWFSGWRILGELPKTPKAVIIVGPHTSNWDFFLGVAVLFALRLKIKFLGKHTIFVPIVKHLLFAIGGIPVDRRSAHGVVNDIARQFEENDKMILAMSPEGTRSPIYPWKTGFLSIAKTANVPVAPIAFNFQAQTIHIGELIYPTDVPSEDMQRVYEFFAQYPGKYPENCVTKSPNIELE